MLDVLVEYDVPVTMRDGVVLRADVYRPASKGPWPVIVSRTPYDKSDHLNTVGLSTPLLAAQSGLIAVIQDVRGRGASEGEFIPGMHEAADGADTIAWAAGLPDGNGRVGMWGGSYLGNVQWLAAGECPPALGAITPVFSPRTVEGLVTRGGARELAIYRGWGLYTAFDLIMRRDAHDEEALTASLQDVVNAIDAIPGNTYDELPTDPDPVVARHRLATFEAGASAVDVSAVQPRVTIPVFNYGGWFDIFLQGTLENYMAARGPARLLIGPWHHESLMPQPGGGLSFGLAASMQSVNLGPSLNQLTFDWLKEQLTNEGEVPGQPELPVEIFVMGENQWRSEATWPLERAVDTKYFLGAEGVLGAESPDSVLTYAYDPADPVPTVGGAIWMFDRPAGMLDQHEVEARDDVLIFSSDVLTEDVEVTGRVTATLVVSTDAPTTDWVVRLCDVHENGRSFNVTDGVVRASGNPGEVQTVEVDMWSTSMLFKKGHRIRVQVTSSCFPRWDRNLNTSDGPATGEMQVARQQVHVGRRSYVSLPVVPRARS
jgi:putative CocE/NonD family hydrolase